MKQKLLLIAPMLFLLNYLAKAQTLTERTNDVSVYKMGNRPSKGTKLLTFGLNLNDTEGNLFSKYNLFQKGNLLTGKYFISDRTAIRGGLRISKQTNSSGGNIDTTLSGGSTLSNNLSQTTRNYAIMPGIERHMSYSNFFDIYFGSDLYLGLNKNSELQDYSYTNGFYDNRNAVTNTTQLGLAGVVGLNVFILDLPISVGIEYGLMGIWDLGGKTHVVEKINDPLGARTNNYYTQNSDALGNPDNKDYSSLKKSSSTIETNSNLRVLLNVYFK